MRVSRILILLPAFISILSTLSMNASTPTAKAPDFAYPQTVSQQACKQLDSAIEKHDSPATVRALLNYYLAETRISTDRAAKCLGLIDSVATAPSSDPVLRAMLQTLEADIYASAYTSGRWKYDSRTLPLTPMSADFREWSGEQFRHRIKGLLDSALSAADALKAVPVKDWAAVLALGKHPSCTVQYYPTLFDFVANKAISLLESTGEVSRYLSWGLLTRHDLYRLLPFNKLDPTAGQILAIYASLLDFHEPGTAPFIITDIGRIDFVSSHVWDSSGSSHSSGSSAGSPRSRRQELLRDLYEENKLTEYSGNILLAMDWGEEPWKPWVYTATLRNLKVFPAFGLNPNLRNLTAQISRQDLSLSHPTAAAPGSEVKFSLTLSNVKSGKLYIYDVSASPVAETSYNCTGHPSKKALAVIPFTAPAGAEVPFSREITLSHRFEAPGRYIAVAAIDGAAIKGRRWYNKIHITSYSLAASGFDNTQLWVMDALNGAPVEGAAVSLVKDSRRGLSSARKAGTTSADGSTPAISITDGGCYAVMSKDGDSYAMPVWVYSHGRRNDPDWRKAASGYPSLPLYHPADTVEWMAICYEYKGSERRPYAKGSVTSVLRDASGQRLDTLRLDSDGFGRIHGSFTLPKDALSGRFSICLDGFGSPVSFMVSDYKLPTFRVILDPAENDFPAKGDVTLRGRVETYAGFPVADAQLTVKLSALQPMRWWWQPSQPVEFQTLEATTDTSGNISLTLPASTLALSPIPGGMFSAEVTALSPTGESQLATATFSTGMRYAIRASVPADIDISSPVSSIKVEVADYRDSIVSLPVDFTVMSADSGRVLLRGQILPGQKAIDLSSLSSGRRILRFALADSTLAAPTELSTVLYRPTDKATPTPGELLWHPSASVKASAATGKASWLYAVDCPTHLLVTVSTPDSIISRDWHEAPEGMNSLPLNLPAGMDEATVNIALTGRYRKATATLTLRRDLPSKGLRFKAESFRNRTVPGSEEQWTFRVTDMSDKGQKAAVVMDMYNTALDALATTQWQFSPASSWAGGWSYSWNQPDLAEKGYQDVSYQPSRLPGDVTVSIPAYETYGLPLFDRYGRMARGIMYKTAQLNVVREHKEEIINMSATADAAPMLAGAANGVMMDMGAAKMEDAEAEEAAVDDESADSPGKQAEAAFTFRDSEVPLAFFRPMLTTDADGRLSLSVSIPDANTTWGLRAIAFTDSLLSTGYAAEVVASKPVMVQPNLPRFIRTADRLSIRASVMNSGDSPEAVSTTIEIFDPSTGRVTASRTQTDSIPARSAATASIELTAPSDAPFIGYRIKSSTASFADGEQALIPVLAAAQPVIDSYPFYLAPGQQKFTMELPVTPADARITLQYTDNPTWYVVTALPGLLDLEASTANEAAASIFSAAVASGLLRDNPAIAEALREWRESPQDEPALTSMLNRNEDLKQVLLAATPWMLDAKNDTERMSRLSLLFDSKTVSAAIEANTATLAKLQRGQGGWAWFNQSDEASQWATENVLLLLGRLQRLGFMPGSKQLKAMTLKALGWIDSETRKDFDKHPDGDYSLYAYLRSLYSNMDGAPRPDSRITSRCTQRILARWKQESVAMKAIDALILNSYGNKSMAHTVLASLRQYAETSPGQGMWWPSLDGMTIWSMDKIGATSLILDAFAAIEPDCADIDAIRQWLILQKEAKGWGSSVTTTAAIASILTTSQRWLAPASPAKISIGGKKVETSRIERLTGSLRTPVADLKPSKPSQLSVSRNGADLSPAWGAMFYIHTNSMASIKAKSCPGLSIDKEWMLTSADGTVSRASTGDSLSLGQRVRVTLTIHADRDMDYVSITDERPACFEPVDQMPTPLWAEGICFYREMRDSSTRLFIRHLPKGVYVLSYDMWVNNYGSFSSGMASIQSHYAPKLIAHSSGRLIRVKP